MEQALKKICAEHGLDCVSITQHNTPDHEFMSVFVHWNSDGLDRCRSGRGSNFDEALSNAIDAKNDCITSDEVAA
ncbi:hypothetical protein ACI0FM_00025 [Paenochrobactrum sp. BZR 588]|uniref:hypothetical protein n=1 Tax=unclassified Paenochrobactrum TaxID=2639760 RepID=UPI00385541D2